MVERASAASVRRLCGSWRLRRGIACQVEHHTTDVRHCRVQKFSRSYDPLDYSGVAGEALGAVEHHAHLWNLTDHGLVQFPGNLFAVLKSVPCAGLVMLRSQRV